MQVRVVGGDALMIPFIAACKDANLAISAAVRVAVEWHAKRSGRARRPCATGRDETSAAGCGARQRMQSEQLT